MPAGFNNGQIEYIKAVANVNGHKTYKPIVWPATREAISNNHLSRTHDTALKYRLFTLGYSPLVYDTGAVTPTTDIAPLANVDELTIFNIAPVADENALEQQRQGAEGFLESTHLRIRCLVDNPSTGGFHSEHNEYRMIVFRHKERQHIVRSHAQNFSNPFYDLFHGTANFKIGFSGRRQQEQLSGTNEYLPISATDSYGRNWVDAQYAMTAPINKEDYVVMKDHRFFLGKEYGGKNIFETTLHWDWRDPIATTSTDVTETESDKNYTWFILFMGNSNNTEGDATLNIQMHGTTHMTSG